MTRLGLRVLLYTALPMTLAAQMSTIRLRDGRVIPGRFLDGNSDTVGFEDDRGRPYRFRTGEVDSIMFNDGRRPGPPPNGQSGPRVLQQGAEISVRTTTMIDSREANDGQIFAAFVQRDVLDASGNVVIPRGSPADLVIRSASGGGIRSSASLVLDVESVTVDSRRYYIDTEDLTRAGGRQGVGANRRTGEFVGGATALGTLLGAVAGGGKGALIGALAGAAAGAGTQVLTKGGEVRVPSETVLTFRIDQQVYLQTR